MTDNVVAIRPGPTRQRTHGGSLGPGNLLLFTGVRYVREGGPFGEPAVRPHPKPVTVKTALPGSELGATERLQA